MNTPQNLSLMERIRTKSDTLKKILYDFLHDKIDFEFKEDKAEFIRILRNAELVFGEDDHPELVALAEDPDCEGKAQIWMPFVLKKIESLSDMNKEILLEFLDGIIERKDNVAETNESLENLDLENFADYRLLSHIFYNNHPIYFDNTRTWWVWNSAKKYWIRVDETDIMVRLDKSLRSNKLTQQHIKKQILENLRIVGRSNAPKDAPKSWIQFKDRIYDIDADMEVTPTHEWFVTNPINYNLGNSEDTPIIDKLFTDWVGESEKKKLYEIVAYCMLPDYPIHRIFFLIGGGRNGKGSFQRLLDRFLGERNRTASDIDRLISSRFEASKLYKKLAVFIGETNFAVLENTKTIKMLCGEDLISGEFKNKDPFDFNNYAKIIINSNSLPVTTDRTAGWYSKCVVIDFPNTFDNGKDIIKSIPESEFENLARKSIRILKELLEREGFSNEGTIKEREKKYEERSNPLSLFIEHNCSKEDINADLPLYEFYEKYLIFLSEKNYRNQTKKEVSEILEKYGFEVYMKKAKKADGSDTHWAYIKSLKWKEFKNSELAKYTQDDDSNKVNIIVDFLISSFGEAEQCEIEKRCKEDYNLEVEKTINIIQKLSKEGKIFEKQPKKWLKI